MVEPPSILTEPPFYIVRSVDWNGERKEAFFANYGRRRTPLGERVDSDFGQDAVKKLEEKYEDNEEISVVGSRLCGMGKGPNFRADAYRKIDTDSDEFKEPREVEPEETWPGEEIREYTEN